MGIVRAVKAFFRELRSDATTQMMQARAQLLSGMGFGNTPVNEQTALTISAFFAAVRTIAETKASLPIKVMEVKADGSTTPTALHPVQFLLSTAPNSEMTPMTCGEVRQIHLLTHGNTFAELSLDYQTGEITGIVPRHPSSVEVLRSRAGRLYYQVTTETGSYAVSRDRMLHVPGFGFDGLVGMSPLRVFAGKLGVALSQDQFQLAFIGNSMKPSLIVSAQNTIPPAVKADLKRDLETSYNGTNAGRPLLLEGGMTATTLSMPLADAQFLELKKDNGKEIVSQCFKLPPHVAGYIENYQGLELMDLFFEKHTLRPWLVRDQQEMNRKLFSSAERGRFKVEYITEGLLSADIKSRYDAHRVSLLVGFKTINEVRKLENLPPLEGGDVLPKPAAIWGTSLPGDAAPEGSPKRTDPRFRALTVQTLQGLFQREAHAAERAAKNPESYREKISDFYETHGAMVRERMQFFDQGKDLIDQAIHEHRQLLADCNPADVLKLTARFTEDAERLADALLNPNS